ncbi:MAG: bile acid:sodium symporter family protein [Solirubrobacterales bacterium]
MVDDNLIVGVVLPVALAVIMFTLGLGLTLDDFRRVFVFPKGVSIGLVNLVLVSPLLAFLIADLLNLDPAIALGLVLLGASPGGTLANMFTHLAKGETALSVTMTAFSSICSVVTIPIFLTLANNYFDAGKSLEDVNMLTVVLRTFLITVLPLSIGMFVRSRSPVWVDRYQPTFMKVSVVLFFLVVLAAILSELDLIQENFWRVAAAALLLNILAMTISFSVARVARLSDRQATAIAMELGIHNGTVAIVVAGMINDELMIPAAVYAVFMYFTGGAFAYFMAKRNSRGEVSEAAPAEEPA